MMTAFLTALLAASVTGSFVWLLLTLLKPLTQKVFSQTWHYYTGLIPAFFLTGAAWLISSGISTAAALMRANAPAEAPSELNVVVAPPVFVYNSVIEKTGETVANARLSAEVLVPFIAAVWLIGGAVFLTIKVAAYVSFRRGISKTGYLSPGIACKLPVLVCPGIVTPMLAGVFKPVIVLPERDYSGRELAMILAHETAHWRHGDMLIKLFLLIVNTLHWFNPLVYRMNRETARLCENACDEVVTRGMDKAERVAYGELILSTVTHKIAPALCSGMSEGANLKRRLLYMLKAKKIKTPVTILAVLAACSLLAGGVWLAASVNSVAAYSPEETEEPVENDIVVDAPEIADDEFIGDEVIPETVEEENETLAEEPLTVDAEEEPDEAYLWPLDDYTQITSPFGTRMHPVEKIMYVHEGVDISAPKGTPVLAAKSGMVAETGYDNEKGNFIRLDNGRGQQTIYAQLSKATVQADDEVEQGDVIGEVGSTGKSTGPHLHFGISVDGKYVNPMANWEKE